MPVINPICGQCRKILLASKRPMTYRDVAEHLDCDPIQARTAIKWMVRVGQAKVVGKAKQGNNTLNLVVIAHSIAAQQSIQEEPISRKQQILDTVLQLDDPATAGQIAEIMGLPRSKIITSTLARLVTEGYVQIVGKTTDPALMTNRSPKSGLYLYAAGDGGRPSPLPPECPPGVKIHLLEHATRHSQAAQTGSVPLGHYRPGGAAC